MATVIYPFRPEAWKLVRIATGEAKTFEEWGFTAPTKFKLNQGIGECAFEAPGALADSAPVLAYDELVKITKDGVVWFQGRVVDTPAMGDGPQEGISYRLVDRWFDLDDLVFQQQWNGRYSSHVILNLAPTGALGSVRGVLLDVINFAATHGGIDIQAGQILPEADEANWFPPPDEVTDATCLEVIQNQLRWVPQAVAWIDDSTEPPTFHCRRAHRCKQITVNYTGPDPAARSWLSCLKAFGIRKRKDLVRPAVIFKYEIRGSNDGKETLDFVIDQWPVDATGLARGTLMQTFPLQGRVVQTVSAPVETAPILAADVDDATRVGWWQGLFPTLARPEVSNLRVTNVERQTNLPRMLVPGGGQLAAWMVHDDEAHTPVSYQEELIQARIAYDLLDASGQTFHIADEEPVPIRIIATDAETGTYWAPASIEEGDPIPQGLAKNIYEALARVQYEGHIVLVADELMVRPGGDDPPNTPHIGTLINLAGLKEEWATMGAVPNRVDEDAEQGTMSVSFGPAMHLGAADLQELLKVGRRRRRWTNPATQEDGEIQGSDGVEFGEATAIENGYVGDGKKRFLKVFKGSYEITLDGVLGQLKVHNRGNNGQLLIDLQSSEWEKAPAGEERIIRVREMVVCVSVGGVPTPKLALALLGEPYALS